MADRDIVLTGERPAFQVRRRANRLLYGVDSACRIIPLPGGRWRYATAADRITFGGVAHNPHKLAALLPRLARLLARDSKAD